MTPEKLEALKLIFDQSSSIIALVLISLNIYYFGKHAVDIVKMELTRRQELTEGMLRIFEKCLEKD